MQDKFVNELKSFLLSEIEKKNGRYRERVTPLAITIILGTGIKKINSETHLLALRRSQKLKTIKNTTQNFQCPNQILVNRIDKKRAFPHGM